MTILGSLFGASGKDLEEIVFDRHYKIWNAGERAGFGAEEALAICEMGAGHRPKAGEVPLPPPTGTKSSGTQECPRCGARFPAGEAHECPKGGGEPDASVFEAGFEPQRARKAPREKPIRKARKPGRGR